MFRVRAAKNLNEKFQSNGNLELHGIYQMQYSVCVLISVGRSPTDSRLEFHVSSSRVCTAKYIVIFFRSTKSTMHYYVWYVRCSCRYRPTYQFHIYILYAFLTHSTNSHQIVFLWFYLYIEIVPNSSCHKFHIIICIVWVCTAHRAAHILYIYIIGMMVHGRHYRR